MGGTQLCGLQPDSGAFVSPVFEPEKPVFGMVKRLLPGPSTGRPGILTQARLTSKQTWTQRSFPERPPEIPCKAGTKSIESDQITSGSFLCHLEGQVTSVLLPLGLGCPLSNMRRLRCSLSKHPRSSKMPGFLFPLPPGVARAAPGLGHRG